MGSATTGWFGAGSSPTVNTCCNVTITRSGTSVTVWWSVDQSIGSSSYLGLGSLVCWCGYAGNNQSRTMKEHGTSWSGGTSNTVTGSYSFYDDATYTKTFTISFWSESDSFSSSGLFNRTLDCSVEGYNPYANFTSLSVQSKTINSFTVACSTDRNAWIFARVKKSGSSNWGEYLNSGEPFLSNVSSGTFEIAFTNAAGTVRLEPNTTYDLDIMARSDGRYGQQDKHDYLTDTTYNIATITTAANFNHGSNAIYTIENPGGGEMSLNFKVGNTSIKTVTPTVGNGQMPFNDTELDTIYTKYGNNNSVTGTYTLTTTQNSQSYNSTKTCTINLTGNQKTIKEKQSNSWKRGKLYIKKEGDWKRAVVWENVNGSWKRGI